MTFPVKPKTIIPSIFMLIFLGACLIISLMTLINERSVILEKIQTNQKDINVFNGEWASNFEKGFEKNMPIRDLADNIWGSISYGFFQTGKDKVIIGKDGWLFTKEEFEPIQNSSIHEIRFLNIIDHVNEALTQHNIQLAIALIPSKSRIYPEYTGKAALPDMRKNLYQRILTSLHNKGIATPDLRETFLTNKDKGLLYLKTDTHWTPLGAKLAAMAIIQTTHPIFKNATNYDLTDNDTKVIDGDLEKYVSTNPLVPWTNLKESSIPQYKLEKISSSQKQGLFDDEIIPVALIGTSYSAIPDWQFEDTLKYALQSDVVNLADEGKGPLSPMNDFLNKNNLQNTDIKLVVWEIPERFIPVDYTDIKFSFENTEGRK